MKDQLLINGEASEIICVHEENGSVHDMEFFKKSALHFLKNVLLIGDKGYQGIAVYHINSLTPYKKVRGKNLTRYQRWFNSSLAKYRIYIEHVNCRIKRFKILQQRYRNKQRKHLLRVSLISGIYNFELTF
ncbi:MAG: transposase [Lactobacillales bacterium]|nr:transposase [Lactobacillales bacterium]